MDTQLTCLVPNGSAVPRVVGEIDMVARDGLLATIERYARDDRVENVVIDLEQVSFLDCSGVSALLAGRRAAVDRRRGFAVVNAQRPSRRVLHLTGALDVLATPTT